MGAARATDVMGWTGHVVREETDGVFDRGLRITLVILQSVSFTDVLWCSRCCVIPSERHCAVVGLGGLNRIWSDEEAVGCNMKYVG